MFTQKCNNFYKLNKFTIKESNDKWLFLSCSIKQKFVTHKLVWTIDIIYFWSCYSEYSDECGQKKLQFSSYIYYEPFAFGLKNLGKSAHYTEIILAILRCTYKKMVGK